MNKVLALMLMLLCLITALPLASANPISDHAAEEAANSRLTFVYPAIIILSVALADSTIYLIRKKIINKHSLLYFTTLTLLISYLGFYSQILTSIHHSINDVSWNLVVNSVTIFGYITMAITFVSIADSVTYIVRKKSLLQRFSIRRISKH